MRHSSFATAKGLTLAAAMFVVPVLIPAMLFAQAPAGIHILELSRSANSVTMEVTLPPPAFDTVGSHVHLRPIQDEIYSADPLAEIAIPIRASRSASAVVLSHKDEIIAVNNLLLSNTLFKDIAATGKPGASVVRTASVPAIHHGIGYASLSYIGHMRAADISRLAIGILDPAGANSIRAARTIVLKITDPNGLSTMPLTDLNEPFEVSNSVFKSRLAMSAGKGMRSLSDSDIQQFSGIQADDGNVYRMYIRQNGIYHITFNDLKNFGIDPTMIDPSTLRIINKGQQVAVYVSDQHNDGHFHPDDYIEFYGQEERYPGPGTQGDFYYDPDTKNNIYYLVWGTHYSPIPLGGLKRMVEESGEIRTANRSPYPRNSFYVDLQDSSFYTTQHVEQNNVHDPLDVTDIDERSDLTDHDFMAIVSTGGIYPSSYTVNTVVPFPDVRAGRPANIRVALHGISNFLPGSTDPKGNELPNVPNEDDCMVAINQQDILHGIWGGQTLKFLSTDTPAQVVSYIPPDRLFGVQQGDTSGGIDPLAITFTQQKQTNVPGCRFGINWVNIGYDRMYYAYQNVLDFHAPPYCTPGLYQFTLQNFDQTDISVYRIGVSKITNIVITSNPNVARSTKAIFQVTIAGPSDEFIAVVDSTKLKPYKYEKDDFLNLHSPANQGAYVIITNRDHLPKGNNGNRTPVEDLADYRASHNHVTTKVIDVANIYDEFSYGSASPNAIKAFLSYAYHYWQDPPKYVLLVGVTHRGTDDSLPYYPPDQVPAPFIQAYLEGDVAADAWYTMLDGNDLIPDLLLGRLASQDIATDAEYVAKVEAYEADQTSPGDWKDRALFIGAGPSFDTDIDRILDNELPSRVSVLRESTIPTSPYHGAPHTLFDYVNNGLGLVAYFGHGGADIWDDPINDSSGGGPFLTNDEVGGFQNQGRWPVILSMTCFTATYDGSGLLGILNSLQNLPNAGSIAALGTTSYGWEQNDARLASAVIPHIYDSVGGPLAEKIMDGKIDYILQALPGDLIPPTLMYAYHFLGDPLLPAFPPTDHVSLAVSNRVIQPGGSVTLSGTTTIQQGTAHIELANEYHSPLVPAFSVDNIPVTNGTFSQTVTLPATAMPYGTFRAIVYDKSSDRYAATGEDVTITNSRVTELDFEPKPLAAGVPLDFSAAVQTPNAITSVTAYVNLYRQNPGGFVTMVPLAPVAMALQGDRYHVLIPASAMNNGDKVVAHVVLVAPPDSVISDSLSIIVGAASDPAAIPDMAHRALSGRFVSTSQGLAWQERVYNWGSSPMYVGSASLLNVGSVVPVRVGFEPISNIPPHGDSLITMPIKDSTLDSATLVCAVSPIPQPAPLNLRDSIVTNDTTLPLRIPFGAAAYRGSVGTTMDGSNPATIRFSHGEAVLTLPAGAESNVASDVIRLSRQYTTLVTSQPDIHFLPMYSDSGKKYTSLRIVSDSLGAIPLVVSKQSPATLSVTLNLNDSLIRLHQNDSLYLYRLDDRSKLWTILSTTRPAQNQLTAQITNLGTFAIAYNTDIRPPLVDMTVEGQVFTNNGEVPPQPHIDAIMQDANGIDVTPGKTIVKIDNRVLLPSEFTVLDSSRTLTTVNLTMSPTLSAGTHTITVQATDDNGKTNSPPAELDVRVSNSFGVDLLGSYPNPFTRDYMFIAYQIRGIAAAQSVSLDIYTVAGRRIRTMSYPNDDPTRTYGFLKGGTGTPTSLGYHEVWWDGRDDGGSEVANGVYFYRLTVSTPASSVEVKGKFARLR